MLARYWLDIADVGGLVDGGRGAFTLNQTTQAVDLKRETFIRPWLAMSPTSERVEARVYRGAGVANIPDCERYTAIATVI